MQTPSDPTDDGLAQFLRYRPRLFGLAYRMLGQRAEAEDLVQEAWLRWQASERSAIAQPEAWLVAVTSRLAVDRLRRLHAERAHYQGFWLPEPLVQPWAEETAPSAQDLLERAGDVSTALMFVLEQLTPDERAAFLLREVFDADYAEVAQALGRSEAACRQLVHRARGHVQAGRPRFSAPPGAHAALLRRFAQAVQGGDFAQIQALFAPDAELISDGGGKVPSFGRVLQTGRRLALLYFATARRLRRDGQRQTLHLACVNGLPGLLRCIDGQLESVQTLLVEDGLVRRIYTLRNPDKLAGVTVPPQMLP
ncbi:RNA polymerase sigma factor SigJ [Delftia sp. PS-11]|uniref:RNA polymerase sigma factor SigJ n=1 Tax=Delftia sp. PS-11 TaxID=2767222 RepID=UPI002453DFDF|nr:RNA polymerase sigma factor SigJ [Delftia sp. PS-11]KAJ8743210.1 RNA polymerase sigma factor SigJ [Delftia sp. PS-11]